MSSPTKKFRISELKVVVSSEQAPVGTLLQIREQKLDIIGMRCEIAVNGSRRPYFLPLRGDQRGELIEGALLTGPALDVSSLVDVAVIEPAPRRLTDEDSQLRGIVCEVGAGSGLLVIRAQLGSIATTFQRDSALEDAEWEILQTSLEVKH